MKSVLVAAALVGVTALVLWGALHVFISPVNPDQSTPEGHFAQSCWACHFVSEGAKIIEE